MGQIFFLRGLQFSPVSITPSVLRAFHPSTINSCLKQMILLLNKCFSVPLSLPYCQSHKIQNQVFRSLYLAMRTIQRNCNRRWRLLVSNELMWSPFTTDQSRILCVVQTRDTTIRLIFVETACNALISRLENRGEVAKAVLKLILHKEVVRMKRAVNWIRIWSKGWLLWSWHRPPQLWYQKPKPDRHDPTLVVCSQWCEKHKFCERIDIMITNKLEAEQNTVTCLRSAAKTDISWHWRSPKIEY